MKTFFLQIKRSLSDWGWYKEIARGEHPLKVTYALLLSLIFAIIIGVYIAIGLYAFLIPAVRQMVNTQFPQDLVVTIKSDTLSVNQPTPYRIELPKAGKKHEGNDKVNLLVIDPDAPADLDSPEKYETIIFANKDTIVVEKNKNEIRAYPLKDVPDLTISRETVNHALGIATRFAWLVAIVAIIPVMLASFAGMMITFLLSGFILWLIMKITSRPILFKNAFAIAMYAYTFIFILNIIFFFISGGIGFLLSSLLIVILALVFLHIPDRPNTPPVINATE